MSGDTSGPEDDSPPGANAQCYTVAEVARLLACSQKHVRREIADGRMRHIRLGRAIRVHHDALIEYIRGREGTWGPDAP